METAGGLLALASIIVFLAGLVALVRPIRKIGLGSRFRAGLAVIASMFMFVAGASMLPPPDPAVVAAQAKAREAEALARKAASDERAAARAAAESERQLSDTAAKSAADAAARRSARTVAAQPRAGVDLHLTDTAFVAQLNSTWSEMKRTGAFTVSNTETIDNGRDAGGRTQTVCVNRNLCAVTATGSSGHLTMVTMMGGGDGSVDSGVDVMAGQLAAAKILTRGDRRAGEAVVELLTQAQERGGTHNRVVGDVCLSSTFNEVVGAFFVIGRAPCD